MSELEHITRSMDIPVHKRANVAWLIDNAFTRNFDHPRIGELVQCLRDHASSQRKTLRRIDQMFSQERREQLQKEKAS